VAWSLLDQYEPEVLIMGELLTPEMAGFAPVDLVRADPATTASGYLLSAAGLQKLP
jgi:hypothetical protein